MPARGRAWTNGERMSTTGDYIAAQKDDHSPENVSPWYRDGDVTLYAGDAARVLAALPAGCVNTCVTSPPYFGLRDYGTGDAQVGREETPEEYVARLVGIFREVRRVLRDDGTLWINLGDSYAGGSTASKPRPGAGRADGKVDQRAQRNRNGVGAVPGVKPKDLIGIPWMVAFALRADGWYLRSDVIWAKPNPMPESVKDRPTKAHEYLFLLTKNRRYYYDADAVREPANQGAAWRNRRSVWTVTPRPYKGAHFAVFPPALIEPCVLAGSPEGGTVLDPFIGSGTTAEVARSAGRHCIGIDLNGEYLALAVQRLGLENP
jgi:site-specific DNA-methyltransferase (cytosine-N4-specific)